MLHRNKTRNKAIVLGYLYVSKPIVGQRLGYETCLNQTLKQNHPDVVTCLDVFLIVR